MAEPEAARPLQTSTTQEDLQEAGTPQEVLDTFSVHELEEALRRRNAEGVAEEEGFLSGIEDYFDPTVSIDTASQLAIVSDFWIKLGYEVPILSSEQQSRLAETVEANPDKRVVPAPFMSLEERSNIVSEAKRLPRIDDLEDADSVFTLGIPGEWHNIYGQLLRDPESTVKEGITMTAGHGLRYKTPAGETVTRKAYKKSMLEAGQAIKGSKTSVWTFPVMEVGRENTGRNNESGDRISAKANHFYDAIEPSSTPEALIALEVLRRLGTEPSEDTTPIDGGKTELKDSTTTFANEFVYRLNRNGDIKKLLELASVVWDPNSRQISNKAWVKEISWKHFGTRDTVSGIKGK